MSTANPATGETVNVGAIIGGVLGGGLALIFSIIVFIIIVGVIIGKRKQERVDLQDAGSTKRYSSYTVSLEIYGKSQASWVTDGGGCTYI